MTVRSGSGRESDLVSFLPLQPSSEVLYQRAVIEPHVFAHESLKRLQVQTGERRAAGAFPIEPFPAQEIDAEALAVEAPYFGDAQGGVNCHAVDRAARDVDLDGQIRWGIRSQINLFLFDDGGKIGNVETIVRFQAALQVLAAKCGGTAADDGYVQFFSKGLHESPDLSLA